MFRPTRNLPKPVTVAAGPSELGLEFARKDIIPRRAVRLGRGHVGHHFCAETKTHMEQVEEQSHNEGSRHDNFLAKKRTVFGAAHLGFDQFDP